MSEMNTISKHVTLAERTPNPNDYPGAKPEMLVPLSVVLQKPKQRVNLNDCYQWWTDVPGADWRHHKLNGRGRR